MFTKNIKFKNFIKIKKPKINKILRSIIKDKNIVEKYPLLKTMDKNYKYTFKKRNFYFNPFSEFNILGMGGSILGSEAIYNFLKHKINKKFNFYNTLKLQNIPKTHKKNINIVISKSGNTLETISNFNLLLKSQKRNKNIILCENNKNFLRSLGKKLKAEIFEHKNYIGGRYSVLSEVGMLPAEFMGLNEKKFKRFNYLINNKNFINSLIENVTSIFNYIKNGKTNLVILNYDQKSDSLFQWYQQLLAESLGKNKKGIFPIVSSMPKDNHSLMQLFLDGPKNNFYTIFSAREKKLEKLDKNYLFNNYTILKNKSINKILESQKIATENIFKKEKIPFRSFEIINRNEESLGELFSFFILETILLGHLLKVNPFDQPKVELIKNETRKILF
jgi:glucose-6-phosphate isomerase|tara:strand:+ start:263 stop:1432 length:1170 start_codon:yes stop_codon:yes gene_type:complete